MLSKKEKLIMNYIYKKCANSKSHLLYYETIVKNLKNIEISTEEFEKILTNLSYDGYIFLEKTEDKKGLVYVVSLDEKGKCFKRELEVQQKKLILQIVKTILLAVLSFVVGIVLKSIF